MERKSLLRKVMIEKSRRSRGLRGENKFPDATSMGDLSFLLFIFFIVTSSFILREGIFFSLPSPKSGVVMIDPSKAIEVYPENEGFKIGNMILSRENLTTELKKLRQFDNDKIIIIHMNPTVTYDRFVDTLSVARETGFKKVSLRDTGD